ncbi:MAG: asparagine--tRNA ligase [Candidatus Eremiobacteraeota bacterium]|nr:asparagine--tRNA ligase [Candidatus Eremiobacteraeota bacterium]
MTKSDQVVEEKCLEPALPATIQDIAKFEGKRVEIKGWLYNKRSSGRINFLQIRDGSGIIQGVMVKKEVPIETFKEAKKLGQESAIIVTGTVRADERADIGYELSVDNLVVISETDDYPITPKDHGTDFLLDHRHLWFRSKRQHAIMRVRSEIINACRDYFNDRGYILFDSPILTPSACEGTSNLFGTKYFDEDAYLTQSGQLYVEAGALAFGKVYCFGPTFRAEKSRTRRHLMEFWMIEPEIAYINLEENMEIQEDFVEYVVQRVLSKMKIELKIIERDISKLEKVKKPFPRVQYDEAVEILKKKGVDFTWGDDFGAEHETILTEEFDRPFFVHRYPAEAKAFYMKRDPERLELALCSDMLAPEGYGEIIGGGQREDDYDELLKRVREHELPEDAYRWYLDLRKYGSVPHGGFGLGIERTVAWVCGLHHVRETIPFPRMLNRMYP